MRSFVCFCLCAGFLKLLHDFLFSSIISFFSCLLAFNQSFLCLFFLFFSCLSHFPFFSAFSFYISFFPILIHSHFFLFPISPAFYFSYFISFSHLPFSFFLIYHIFLRHSNFYFYLFSRFEVVSREITL